MPQEYRDNFFIELLKFVLLAAAIVVPVRLFIAQPFIVSGASMEPTFESGEYLIIDELSYHFAEPGRGDVVIFRYPRNPRDFFIKRVVGLPGETVVIKGGAVEIRSKDGNILHLEEPYLGDGGNGRDSSLTLRADEYFVLGDNRAESSDSRIWGAVPRGNIIGRALLRLLPLESISLFPGAATPQ